MTSLAEDYLNQILIRLNTESSKLPGLRQSHSGSDDRQWQKFRRIMSNAKVSAPEIVSLSLADMPYNDLEVADNNEIRLVHMSLACQILCSNLQLFVSDGDVLMQQIRSWTEIEQSSVARWQYLIQSESPSQNSKCAPVTQFPYLNSSSALPSRLSRFLQSAMSRLNASPPLASLRSTFSIYKSRLTSTLLLTSLFPHLSGQYNHPIRPIFMLNLTTSALVGQELRIKKARLEKALQHQATRVGALAISLRQLENVLTTASNDELLDIENCYNTSISSLLLLKNLLIDNLQEATLLKANTRTNFRFSDSVQQVLSEDIFAYRKHQRETILNNETPRGITRLWPRLLIYPIVMLVIARSAYSSRRRLIQFLQTARATTWGFLDGWVIQPCLQILRTMKHGQTENSLALMSKASLTTDLDSLERMVKDFARDYGKVPTEMLDTLGAKVKEGDLTLVLREWEEDIKSPVKSAIAGNLIRVLMIQIQKVKVDVDLAMSGIEKLLQSQQLTFAFVGVAPSLIILVGLGRWLRTLAGKYRGIGGRRQARNDRRLLWDNLRHIEQADCCSDVSNSSLGMLLIRTQSLRDIARRRPLNADPSLKEAYLADLRMLETASSTGAHHIALQRIRSSWSGPLNLSAIF